MHIRNMYLDNRRSNRTDSILQGDRGMRVGTRIQDNPIYIKTGLLNLIYQLSLNVRLKVVYLYISILLTKFGKVIFKSNTAVNGRFTFAQQIDIRAINYLYPHNTIFYTFVPEVPAPYQVRTKSVPSPSV